MLMAKKEYSFEPDFAIPPGETLKEVMESLEMSQKELATRTGLTVQTINRIFKGEQPITYETANRLELSTGVPARMWNNLEAQYREQLAKMEEKKRLEAHLDWLKAVPVNDMAKLGWLRKHKDKLAQLEEIVRFFGVASPEQWTTVWREHQVAYRQTQRFESCAESVSAWLRKGEIEARQIRCAPFDKKRFQEVLEGIRGLTREEPLVFQPRLVELCASAGVAVVFVPELPKSVVYGATRWLGEKAVIQLSLRYKTNDHLWFTFFHEAGHILKHGRKEIFIEGNGLDGEKEKEANAFARDKLIPPAAWRRFLTEWNRSHAEIETFANQIGIAPGIVVGRLQHDELLPNSHGNKLKIFYRWSDEGSE